MRIFPPRPICGVFQTILPAITIGLFESAFGCTQMTENGSVESGLGRLAGCLQLLFLLLLLQVEFLSPLQIVVNIGPKLF